MSSNHHVATLLDGMKPNRKLVSVWLLCAAVLLLDGYDLTVIALMAPELVKDFGFAQASLGIVFSAGLVGMAIGGPFGGWIGDRHGRKLPLAAGCCLFGCATLAMVAATTVVQFAACRFVVGVGLGVALTSAIAICAEFAPGRMRSRILALVGTSVPLGAMIPGVLTATHVPVFGWKLLVVVGGVLPVLLAIALVWALPESIKYLALHRARHAQLATVLQWLDRDLRWVPSSAAVPEVRPAASSFSLLFQNGFAGITLIMWTLFFMNAMALYLVSSWLPITLRDLGIGMSETGQMAALFSAAGMIGCLIVAAVITRAGVVVLPTLFVLAIPFLLGFAVLDRSYIAILLCVLVPGLACGGIQVASSTIVGTLYPTRIRANGIGWSFAAGRLGAIVGPLFGAVVYSLNLPPQRMFAFAAMPMTIGALAAILLPVLCIRRFGSVRVDRPDREDELPPASRSADPDNRRPATDSAAMP